MSKSKLFGLKVGLVALLLAIAVLSVFTLTACGDKLDVAELQIVEGSVPEVAEQGKFNISDVRLLVIDSEGKSQEIAATSAMLTTEGRAALQTPGEQSITIYYQQKTVVFTVLIVPEGTETVKVSFVDLAGNSLGSKTVVKGSAVTAPEAPKVDGQVFVGWADVTTGQEVSLSKVETNMTVKPVYSENATEYTVTFVDYKGNTVATQTVRHGSKITPPSYTKPSELASYDWGVDFSTYTVTGNVTFNMSVTYVEKTVEYYYAFNSRPEVTYYTGISESVRVGQNATKQKQVETSLASKGLTFLSWLNTSTVINVDTKMVALVEDRYFTISYKNGDFDPQQVLSGTVYTLPASANALKGHTFNGQWKDADGKIYTGSLTVEKDLVLEPVYNKKQIPVTVEFTFSGLKVAEGDSTDRTERVTVDDAFYGDVIDKEYIDEILADLIKNNADYADYTVESILFSTVDVTVSGLTLDDVVGGYAFEVRAVDKTKSTEGLVYSEYNDGYAVTAYNGDAKIIYISDEYNGKPVVKIGDNVFANKEIAYISIPASVKEIGDGAFANATFGSDVILPDLEKFGNKVFAGAKSVETENADGELVRQQIAVVFGENSTFASLDGNTFNGTKGIVKVTLPASVTEITDRTEYSADGKSDEVKEINLDNVTKIGVRAFYNGSLAVTGSLAAVTEVGSYAFYGSDVESLDLPNVKVIGEGAFAEMKSLTALSLATQTVLGEGETGIEFNAEAIRGDVLLGSVTLGEAVTALSAGGSDYGCSALAVFNLPSALKSYSNGFFANFKGIKEVNVEAGGEIYLSDNGVLYTVITVDEDTAQYLGYEVGEKIALLEFYPFGKTGDYVIPEKIGSFDVAGIQADLSEVRINTLTFNTAVINSVISSQGALSLAGSADSVNNMIVDGAILGTDKDTFAANLGYLVTLVTEGNFDSVIYLKGDVIAEFNDVVSENGWASKVFLYEEGALSVYDSEYELVYIVKDGYATVLYGNKGAENITVPSELGGYAVKALASNAFKNYTNLKGIEINAVLNGLDNTVFAGCDALEEISVAGWDAKATVASDAFADTVFGQTRNLIVLGGKIIVYNNYEADEEKGITTVVTAADLEGITVIPAGIFADKNVSEIYFADSVVAIEAGAFENCASLTTVDFNKVLTIGDNAFSGSGIVSANLTSVTTLGKGVFSGAASLESVVIPGKINSGYLPVETFKDCASLVSVEMPEVINLSADENGYSYAFNNCVSLTDISFASSFASIPGYAFSGTGVVSVDFSKMSVTNIGYGAFAGCSSLENVVLDSKIPAVAELAFYGCAANLTVKIVGTGGILNGSVIEADVFPAGTTFYIASGANPAVLINYNVETEYPRVAFEIMEGFGTEGSLDMPALLDTIYMEEAPQAKAFDGYIFEGWYKKENDNYIRLEFPLGITEDMIFYAKYYKENIGSLTDADVDYDEEQGGYVIVGYTDTQSRTAYIPAMYEGGNGLYPIVAVYAGAFAECVNLESLALPEGVKTIYAGKPEDGSATFNTALRSLSVPSTVETIQKGVFSGVNAEFDIIFAANSMLINADKSVFEGTAWYTAREKEATEGRNNGFVIAGRLAIAYLGEEKSVVLPSDIYKLADGLFKDNEIIEEIVLNDALMYIGQECFTNASNLKEVSYESGNNQLSAIIEATLSSFEGTAWYDTLDMVIVGTILLKYKNTTGKETVTVPEYITEIGDGAFEGSTMKTLLFAGNSALKKIGDRAFANSLLTVVTLPAGVTEMGEGVFEGCSGLQSADLSAVAVRTLPANTFSGNSELKEVILSEATVAFGAGSFSGCLSLASITAPGFEFTDNFADTGISDTAFYTSSIAQENDTFVVLGKVLVKYVAGNAVVPDGEVKVVTVPEGVEIILANVFNSATFYKIILPAELKVIDDNAFLYSRVTEVEFAGSGLLEVGESAFENCTNLSIIVLPDTVTEIGADAFKNTALTEIDIPDSVVSIGSGAFANNASLGYVRLSVNLTEIGSGAFAGNAKLNKISWLVATAVFEELNANIENALKASLGEEYADEDFAAFINGLFEGAMGTQDVTYLRMYAPAELYNFVNNTDNESGDKKILAWKNAESFALFADGTYPTVSFDSDGYYMSSFNAEVIETIGTPARSGHTFKGWYTDNGRNNPLVLPYYVYSDLTLYADWYKNDLETDVDDTYGFRLVDNEYYEITSVATDENTIYIPTTVAGYPVKSVNLTKNVNGVTKIVLTDAAAFNGMASNIFRFFPDLTEVELVDNGLSVVDMVITDGVLYSADGTVLMAYLATYTEGSDGEQVKNTEFTIPDTVTTILSYAFANSGLEKITLGKGVAAIGEKAFNDGLGEIVFSAEGKITDADSLSFDNTVWYENSAKTEYVVKGSVVGLFYSAGNILIGYDQKAATSDLIIPNQLKGFDITVIAGYINSGARESEDTVYSFNNLTLPNKLTKINSKAFAGIDVLVNINTDSTVLSDIANDVFSDTTFYIQSNSEMIILGKVLLKCINTATNIEVPNGIEAIANRAFADGQVRTISLPSTLKYIGDEAFYGAKNLETITIPDSVLTIGEAAFALSLNLQSVNFNASSSKLNEIGASAFQGCNALTSIDIPYTVEKIGASAFLNCRNLTSVNFDYILTTEVDGVITTEVKAKSKLTELGEMAFYDNRKLTSITIPDGLTEIGRETFYGCSLLETVNFDVDKSNLKVIGEYAFAECSSLGSKVDVNNPSLVTVILPNALITVERNAFQNCSSMLGIRFNYNLKNVASDAFDGCKRLTKIEVFSSTPANIASGAFDRGDSPYYKLRIYVGASVNDTIKNDYKAKWTEYADNIYDRSELPLLVYCHTTSSGSGTTDNLSDPIATDIVINPTYTWGNTTYSTWKYKEFANKQSDGEYAVDGSVARLNQLITAFDYQIQANPANPGQPYTLLILDYDRVTVTTST